MSRTAAGSGRAVLEGVGLSHEAIQMCYSKSFQNEEEAIQSGLMKWRDGSGDSPTWAVLIEAMEYAEIGLQHIKEMKEKLLKGEVCQLFGQSSISASHNMCDRIASIYSNLAACGSGIGLNGSATRSSSTTLCCRLLTNNRHSA